MVQEGEYPRLQIFDLKFEHYNNEDLANDFNDYFYKQGLMPLFTNEQRATIIEVGYADARSVVGAGKFHGDLKRLARNLSIGDNNKKYEEAVFKIIYQATNFKSLMNNIRKINQYIETQIYTQHLFNTWNIVFYDKNSMR